MATSTRAFQVIRLDENDLPTVLFKGENDASWVRITTAGGITTNYIRVVFVDQYDTLWLGGGDSFAGGGLMRYVP